MNFPPYVPEVIRNLYKETFVAERYTPEVASRLKEYLFSPDMKDAYFWFSSIVESDNAWIIFFGIGTLYESINPSEIQKLRNRRNDQKQLEKDARAIEKKIEKKKLEILDLEKSHKNICKQIETDPKEVEDHYSLLPGFHSKILSNVMGRENNLKTESIRLIVTTLYDAGFDPPNANLLKAIAIMARVLFDYDGDITYDDVRKVIKRMDIPPWSFG
jgi:hypothetical protein